MSDINLNNCVKGQKLKMRNGLKLKYLGINMNRFPYCHEVQYAQPNQSSFGTRCDNGQVFKNSTDDKDVVFVYAARKPRK